MSDIKQKYDKKVLFRISKRDYGKLKYARMKARRMKMLELIDEPFKSETILKKIIEQFDAEVNEIRHKNFDKDFVV